MKIAIDKIGDVELPGVGPWQVRNCGPTSEIVDSNGKTANPTVYRSTGGAGTVTKGNQNVVFAKPATTALIVEKANEALAA